MTYFLIGIKGKGMRALAKYLCYSGETVEGYDSNSLKDNISIELETMGIKLYDKLSNEILFNKEIIITPAIQIDSLNVTIEQFKFYHEYIAQLTQNTHTICIAGSFGKTTTTSFLTQILGSIKGCNYIVGEGTGFYKKENNILVVESCEYQKHFLKYSPQEAIITNIGLEHLDCYNNLEEIINTFAIFSNNCIGNQVIYGDINIDYKKFNGNIIFYGFHSSNDVVIKQFYWGQNKTIIEFTFMKKAMSIEVPIVLAKHQVLDLIAAITMSYINGCAMPKIKHALRQLKLPKYRLVQKRINDIEVISDFCGHYAGIQNNIQHLKSLYPNRKITVIFEPISYVRTIKTLDLICEALKEADSIYICDIVPLRENNIDKFCFSCQDIIRKLSNAQYYNKQDNLYFDTNTLVAVFAIVSNTIIERKIFRK